MRSLIIILIHDNKMPKSGPERYILAHLFAIYFRNVIPNVSPVGLLLYPGRVWDVVRYGYVGPWGQDPASCPCIRWTNTIRVGQELRMQGAIPGSCLCREASMGFGQVLVRAFAGVGVPATRKLLNRDGLVLLQWQIKPYNLRDVLYGPCSDTRGFHL